MPSRPSLFQRALKALRPVRPSVHTHRAMYEGVLGTSVHLHLVADAAEVLRPAEDALFDEIARLEAVFSRFDPHSELNRWLATGGEAPVSPDLGDLLGEALLWQHGTAGAFNPASDALSALWRGAEAADQLPDAGALAAVAQAIQTPSYSLSADGCSAVQHDSQPLNFNAFAKGRIVDRAARAVPGVREVLLNIGGDLRHLGSGPVLVHIADPFSRADNAAPVASLRVRGQAVATSGHTWRGFQIGGRWYSHVLDPRTGHPADHIAGVSLLADDAASADVLATALNVLPPAEGLALADSLPRVGCHITTVDRQTFTNAFWRAHTA